MGCVGFHTHTQRERDGPVGRLPVGWTCCAEDGESDL